MNKYLVLFIVLLIFGMLQGTTITVDIEGNGDYNSIQEGINTSVDGDTVLVYPGRYFENVDYIGKTITVASLEMTTGNRDYIYSTIIDGNQTSCCVYVNNNEGDGTTLRGFTITNGNGYVITVNGDGGGIFTRDACLDVINCLIENNHAFSGGGILVSGTALYLEGCTIRNNTAMRAGGGISCGRLYNTIEFSYTNRCNIYDNFAPAGQDICNIYAESVGMVTDVIVDTFTVSDPYGFELYQGDTWNSQNYVGMTFDILQAKYEKIEADLYVAPWGNDDNSGLNEAEALYSINKALQLISADSENPRTVHLTNGLYAPWYESQTFPLVMRSYVSLIGESEENTIIDLQNGNCGFIIDLFGELGYEVKNMTIQNGYLPEDNAPFFGYMNYVRNEGDSEEPLVFENITFRDNDYFILLNINEANLTLRNVDFYGNHCEYGNQKNYNLRARLLTNFERSTLVENCIFQNNYSGVVYFPNSGSISQGYSTNSVVNCQFTQNEFENEHTPYFPEGISIVAAYAMELNIVNCTFTDNHWFGPTIGNAPIYISNGVYAVLANNLLYANNTSHSIIARTSGSAFPVVVVHHNIIENGFDGVLDEGNFVIWDEETNWDEDPLFLGEGDFPYELQDDSPAIDMGTTILPDGVTLPEFDLAGNPRIMGSGIDLGAYEYNPFSNPVTETELEDSALNYYPNPVRICDGRGAVIINYTGLEQVENYQIGIYNIKGQKVWESELKRGYSGIRWDCCNTSGDKVATGVYFLRLSKDGEFLEQGKLTVIR
ncbi:MAG: choice-of-anchor Q domain-containing protein [Candidatus Stygibacter australis]|nr:choice-of-anchor Q domain-containing protein [Candidatus Stygibacter australis]